MKRRSTNTSGTRLGGLLLACLALLGPAFGEPEPPESSLQSESVADRTIVARDFDEFRTVTEMPSVSPALPLAGEHDLVITYDDLPGKGGLTAVVLKPRPREGVYDVPEPPPGADVFRFLDDHLEEAADRRAGLVRFPKDKTLTIAPPRAGALHLNLHGFEDAVIDLNGCTLEFTEPSPGIVVEKCHRMVLRNGTIRGNALLATIARIDADDTAAGVRFTVLPEYRERLEKSFEGAPELVTVGDAERAPGGGWRIRGEGYSELFVNRGGKTNNFAYHDGAFVATAPRDPGRPLEPGGYVWLLHRNNAGHAVLIDSEEGNSDLGFEDLVFVNIPGMVIVGDVERGIHVDRVDVKLDPDDPLAIFAASSDGIHLNANGGDVVIENCNLGPNADDKITNKGNYWAVTALDPRTNKVTVEPAGRKTSLNRWGATGQVVVFVRGDFSVVGTTRLTRDPFRDSSKRHVLDLAEIPEGVRIGTLVGNVDNSGARMVVRNNVLHDTRAQGVLVQTRHVVVEGNTFEGIAGPAIKVALSLGDWYEGVATGDVLIRENTFRRCSRSLRKPNALIHVEQRNESGEPVEVIDRVRIVGNGIE